ncbi:unnamed protein product, partial [Didymodactylos carnosus]
STNTYVYDIKQIPDDDGDDYSRKEDKSNRNGKKSSSIISSVNRLKERELDLIDIFNADTLDDLDLTPLRDEIYNQNYRFDTFRDNRTQLYECTTGQLRGSCIGIY